MPATSKPRRTWLFVAGADEAAQRAAEHSAADVLIHELEDFTPPNLRPKARSLAKALYARWRAAGKASAVRVNPLSTCGRDDLAAVLGARPDIVMMSKVAAPEQVRALAKIVGRGFELVPNIESAAGLVRTIEIARASPQVTAALVASEDMVADLGTARSRTAKSSPTYAPGSSSSAAPPAWRRSTARTRSATFGVPPPRRATRRFSAIARKAS